MATVSADQAATTYPVFKPAGFGQVGFAYGVYEIASALSKDDVVNFFYLPPCRVTDGWLRADDIDTGTEALEIDVGVTGGDTDQLLNSGVITGDAVGDHLPAHAAATVMLHFNGLGSGPVAYTSETLVSGLVVAAANNGGTGTLYCGAYYIEPAVS